MSLGFEDFEMGFEDYREVVSCQRSTKFVMTMLGLTPEMLAGETILDLGSGFRQEFARDAEELGATVISLDPNLPHMDEYVDYNLVNELRIDPLSAMYFDDELRNFRKEHGLKLPKTEVELIAQRAAYHRQNMDWPEEAYGKAVAGIAQALPFADRSFDRVVAMTSVPYGITRAEIPAMLAEANRVLKRGGKGHFWPTTVGDMTCNLELDEIRQRLKDARRDAVNKVEKQSFNGFGLEFVTQPGLIEEYRVANRILSDHGFGRDIVDTQYQRVLVLTRKVA